MNNSETEEITDEIIGEAVLALLKTNRPITTPTLLVRLRLMQATEPDRQRMLRGKLFDITGKRRNLTGIRGITGSTLFGYLIPVKEKLSRSAKLLILLLKSLHWSKGGV